MIVPLWAWVGTLAVFAVLIAADLAFARDTGSTGLRGTAVLSGLWITAGLAFGGALWLWQGPDIAGQYFGGYLLEKALSVDNVSGVRAALHLVGGTRPAPAPGAVPGGSGRANAPGRSHRGRRCAHRSCRLDLLRLRRGLAVLLVFIGMKMLLNPIVHIRLSVSLAVITVVVGAAVAASLSRDRTRRRLADQQQGPAHR